MKIYVDEQKRYEDTKATGQCFTAVGAIGLIAIVLLDTGVIKLAALDSVNRLMISIVMGLVFLIFFIIFNIYYIFYIIYIIYASII